MQLNARSLGPTLVMALALLTTGVAAATPPPEVGCIFAGQVDEAAVDRALRAWWTAPKLIRWDASIGPKVARFTLHAAAGAPATLTLTLADDCARPPTAALTGASASATHAGGLAELARDLPLRRTGAATTKPKRAEDRPWSPFLLLLAMSAALLLGAQPRRRTWTAPLAALVAILVAVAWGWLRLSETLTPADRLPRPFLSAAVVGIAALVALSRRVSRETSLAAALAAAGGLVGLAAWPAARLPFETDSDTIRVLLALVDPFADYGHPFLPLWLTRVLAFGSLEPAALRTASFVFVGLEAAILMLAAGRRGGAIAALLAGTWAASAVWHRPGFSDLSDWNLAAAALLCWLLWLRGWQARHAVSERTTGRQWLTLGLLLVWGLLSSYLMILPALVLLALLARPAIWPDSSPDGSTSRRPSSLALAAIGLVVLGGVAMVVVVFRIRLTEGHQAPSSTAALLAGIWQALPMGQSAWMCGPLALGVGQLLRQWRRPSSQFVLLTTAGIVMALVVTRPLISIAPFYVTLATPLLLEAAAVAVADVGERWWHQAGEGIAASLLLMMMMALAVELTAPLVGSPRGWGEDRWSRFGQTWLAEPLPILSGVESLEFWLTYEEMRAGRFAPRAEVDLHRNFDRLRPDIYRWYPEKPGCEVTLPPTGRPYYVVHSGVPTAVETQRCKAELLRPCHPVFSTPDAPLAGLREMGFYRCQTGPVSP